MHCDSTAHPVFVRLADRCTRRRRREFRLRANRCARARRAYRVCRAQIRGRGGLDAASGSATRRRSDLGPLASASRRSPSLDPALVSTPNETRSNRRCLERRCHGGWPGVSRIRAHRHCSRPRSPSGWPVRRRRRTDPSSPTRCARAQRSVLDASRHEPKRAAVNKTLRAAAVVCAVGDELAKRIVAQQAACDVRVMPNLVRTGLFAPIAIPDDRAA